MGGIIEVGSNKQLGVYKKPICTRKITIYFNVNSLLDWKPSCAIQQ